MDSLFDKDLWALLVQNVMNAPGPTIVLAIAIFYFGYKVNRNIEKKRVLAETRARTEKESKTPKIEVEAEKPGYALRLEYEFGIILELIKNQNAHEILSKAIHGEPKPWRKESPGEWVFLPKGASPSLKEIKKKKALEFLLSNELISQSD